MRWIALALAVAFLASPIKARIWGETAPQPAAAEAPIGEYRQRIEEQKRLIAELRERVQELETAESH